MQSERSVILKGMKLLLATNNMHKWKEFQRIFEGYEVLLPKELELSFEFEEEGSSFLENALGKARTLYGLANRPVLSDDSGLCVPALGGEPGIRSARYGPEGRAESFGDTERYLYLLERMKGREDRQAYFVCSMVLVLDDYRFFTAQETLQGHITEKPAGKGGFGYDPVFFVPERGMTVAQLGDSVKDAISHRGRAGRRILAVIESLEE
jgi:XTP/dITP diphosphohydrolase